MRPDGRAGGRRRSSSRRRTDGRFDLAALGDVVDSTDTAAEIALGAVFILGAAIGILITTAALWRSRAVPRAVPILTVPSATAEAGAV